MSKTFDFYFLLLEIPFSPVNVLPFQTLSEYYGQFLIHFMSTETTLARLGLGLMTFESCAHHSEHNVDYICTLTAITFKDNYSSEFHGSQDWHSWVISLGTVPIPPLTPFAILSLNSLRRQDLSMDNLNVLTEPGDELEGRGEGIGSNLRKALQEKNKVLLKILTPVLHPMI